MSKRDYIKHYSSPNEPSGAQAGDEWYNTATNKLYKRLIDSGTTTSWLELSQERILNPAYLTSEAANVTYLTTSAQTMVPIATLAGTGSASRISFTNIPQTYRHLELKGTLSANSLVSYLICVDLWKTGVKLGMGFIYGQWYGNSAVSGTWTDTPTYMIVWSGVSHTTNYHGSLDMYFMNYSQRIAVTGRASLYLSHSSSIQDNQFAAKNSGATTGGFDQIDIYLTNIAGTASGTGYWPTTTSLTLYGIK